MLPIRYSDEDYESNHTWRHSLAMHYNVGHVACIAMVSIMQSTALAMNGIGGELD